MALKITYFDGYDVTTRQCYGIVMGSASVELSGASASLGTPPAGASAARLEAGEDCLVSNNSGDASAANGLFLSAGSVVDIRVAAAGLKGMTA